MSMPFRVERGIYIDMNCNGIRPVREGVFIPDKIGTEETEKEFQADLDKFIKK